MPEPPDLKLLRELRRLHTALLRTDPTSAVFRTDDEHARLVVLLALAINRVGGVSACAGHTPSGRARHVANIRAALPLCRLRQVTGT